MTLTDKTLQALRILKEHGPLAPRRFAKHMWPESAGWRRYTNCGPYGVTRGGGMNLAAGGFLGKLRRRGLVDWRPRDRMPKAPYVYALSEKGRKALDD